MIIIIIISEWILFNPGSGQCQATSVYVGCLEMYLLLFTINYMLYDYMF